MIAKFNELKEYEAQEYEVYNQETGKYESEKLVLVLYEDWKWLLEQVEMVIGLQTEVDRLKVNLNIKETALKINKEKTNWKQDFLKSVFPEED